MKEILLTQSKVAFVDDEDYDKLNQIKWYASKCRGKWYAKHTMCEGNGKRREILMHREILNAPKGVQVDHIYGDTLFNCKENLRLCTHQQNQFNRIKPQKNNKLGIKGVHWHKKSRKFIAQIQFNGQDIHIGSFTDVCDADSAYRNAERNYFGEFARK